MTNEELLATAEVALVTAGRMGKDFTDLKRAIHGLNYCIDTGVKEIIDFARAVLLTEIEELKG